MNYDDCAPFSTYICFLLHVEIVIITLRSNVVKHLAG